MKYFLMTIGALLLLAIGFVVWFASTFRGRGLK